MDRRLCKALIGSLSLDLTCGQRGVVRAFKAQEIPNKLVVKEERFINSAILSSTNIHQILGSGKTAVKKKKICKEICGMTEG